jgi:hypothetical protein
MWQGVALRRATRQRLFGLACAGLAACFAGPLLASGCTSNAPSPFPGPPGSGGDGGGGGGEPSDAGPDVDPTLGGPCTDDAQCDDGADCTSDACDQTLLLCRFTPDDAPCQNDVYCDGVEVCIPKAGCAAGGPVSCGDETACTIDSCEEATQTCKHAPRDVDRDGDADDHCPGGGDCDDQDPSVSSLLPEVCSNGRDDDCDDDVDEADCQNPEHDTCLDPLEIESAGSYLLDTTAAGADYASSCAPVAASTREVVAALLLDAGPLQDVELTVQSEQALVGVALLEQCGNAGTELACGGSFAAPDGGQIAKLRARGIGDLAAATAWPIYVHSSAGAEVVLGVKLLPPEPPPSNETCGTALPITPGIPESAYLVGVAEDLATSCLAGTGDLVWSFTLDAPANVDVFGASIDGDGTPSLSLRSAACALPEDEITCQTAESAHVFWQSLPAGTYFVSVSASAPTEVSVTVEVSAPTPPAPDETCTAAPPILANQTLAVDLAGHQNDIPVDCLPGAVDAAYALTLPATSDVLLVERVASGDIGGIALAAPACASPADALTCTASASSPARAAEHGVPAGDYRVVVESQQSQSMEVTALVRAASPTTLVPFSDTCNDALVIPPTGGFFQGNTSNASANYDAGCDQGGVPQGGARDQLLSLTLAQSKRVVLDMSGSTYSTLLDVRKGPSCPGQEVAMGCTVGFGMQTSFLDLTLDPGTYYLQIDGLALDEGAWSLEVYVVDP